MPFVPLPSVKRSLSAIESEVFSTPPEPDSPAARQGQAMHWLLEHGVVDASDAADGAPALLARAAGEFDLPPDAIRQAAAMARRIRTADGAWA